MSCTLFRNVMVIDPHSPRHQMYSDILVEGEKITQLTEGGSIPLAKDFTIVEKEGLYASPGWVDMYTELREPGYEWKETMEELALAAAMGGFTDILCYPNTSPCIDHAQIVSFLKTKASTLPVNLHFTATITHDAAGKELAQLYESHLEGIKAFTDGCPAKYTPDLLLRAMQYIKAFDGLVITYPNDPSLSRFGIMNEGDQAVMLGMKGIPEMAESSVAGRDVMFANYSEARLHIQPLTSPTALEQISLQLKSERHVTTGIAIPYLALDDQVISSFDSYYKVFPPIRDVGQVDQLKKAIQNGRVHTLCTAHAAQGPEEKDCEFALAEYGMLSLQTAFSLAYMYLIEPGYIDLSRWVEMISINPRNILRLPPATIQIDQQANLTLFNPVNEWVFSQEMIPSRAKNSPFTGRALRGHVEGLYTRGKWIKTN